MKLWILLFQTALGVVTPGFLQGLEINWKSGANPHGRVSAQKKLENNATHCVNGFPVKNPGTIRDFKSVLARPMLSVILNCKFSENFWS